MSACTDVEYESVDSGWEIPIAYALVLSVLARGRGDVDSVPLASSVTLGTYNVCNVIVVTSVVTSPGAIFEVVV